MIRCTQQVVVQRRVIVLEARRRRTEESSTEWHSRQAHLMSRSSETTIQGTEMRNNHVGSSQKLEMQCRNITPVLCRRLQTPPARSAPIGRERFLETTGEARREVAGCFPGSAGSYEQNQCTKSNNNLFESRCLSALMHNHWIRRGLTTG